MELSYSLCASRCDQAVATLHRSLVTAGPRSRTRCQWADLERVPYGAEPPPIRVKRPSRRPSESSGRAAAHPSHAFYLERAPHGAEPEGRAWCTAAAGTPESLAQAAAGSSEAFGETQGGQSRDRAASEARPVVGPDRSRRRAGRLDDSDRAAQGRDQDPPTLVTKTLRLS